MLVIHGGKDYRLTTCESLSTFTALQRQGVPSRFVYFPDENHWVLKPANSLRWHKEGKLIIINTVTFACILIFFLIVLGWIGKYTSEETSSKLRIQE